MKTFLEGFCSSATGMWLANNFVSERWSPAWIAVWLIVVIVLIVLWEISE